MVRRHMCGILLGLGLGLGSGQALAQHPLQAIAEALHAGRVYVPGELLIQFKQGTSELGQLATLWRQSAVLLDKLASRVERIDGRGDLMQVRLATGQVDIATLIRFLSDPDIDFVEPNWIYTSQQSMPDDPGISLLWSLQGATTAPTHPYGTGALATWDAGSPCTDDVHVGIIDEGVMTTHADLHANIWRNPGEHTQADGWDSDGNGRVDDLHGWDFINGDASVYDGPEDDHGTHVAGTIAAVANNGTGVLGVCPSARVISAKFLGAEGGTAADAVEALHYLTQLKLNKQVNIVATNNSWGGGGYSQAMHDAIAAAGEADILFVAAAGNQGLDNDWLPSYPASYALPNVISVAATGPDGRKADFSNYGAASVHIAAPGTDIVSTVPGTAGASGYAYSSGTSMAAPHVTGAAALYASLNPCATAEQIRAAILRLAVRDPQLAGLVQESRRLEISAMRQELNCPPPAG